MRIKNIISLAFFVMIFCGHFYSYASTCSTGFDTNFEKEGSNLKVHQAIDMLKTYFEQARQIFFSFNRSPAQVDALKIYPIIQKFTPEQINKMTDFQVLRMDENQLKALQKLTPENIAFLNKTISQRRQWAMSSEEIADFSEQTFSEIAKKLSHRILNRELNLELALLDTSIESARNVWGFTLSREVKEEEAKHKIMQAFTGPQKDSMTAEQLQVLTPDQLRALQDLTPKNIALLNKRIPLRRQRAMSSEEIANFSEQALETMEMVTFETSNKNLEDQWSDYRDVVDNGRSSWHAFRDVEYETAIAKDEIMLRFTGPQKDSMTAGQLWHLNPNQLGALQRLTPENIAFLNEKIALRKQLAMSPEEIVNFSEQALETMEMVTFETSNKNLEDQWNNYKNMVDKRKISWHAFRDAEYETAIAKNEIMLRFTGPQKDSMTAEQLQVLTPDQLKALQKLTPENIAFLNEKKSLRRQRAMSPEEIAHFSQESWERMVMTVLLIHDHRR